MTPEEQLDTIISNQAKILIILSKDAECLNCENLRSEITAIEELRNYWENSADLWRLRYTKMRTAARAVCAIDMMSQNAMTLYHKAIADLRRLCEMD